MKILKEADTSVNSLLETINVFSTAIARTSKEALQRGTPEILFSKTNFNLQDVNNAYAQLKALLYPENQGE